MRAAGPPPLLRPAAPHDADAIARIWHAGYADGHAGHVPDEIWPYRRRTDFDARVPDLLASTTVAEQSGSVLGFVMVQGDEVYQLYVDAPARGTGAAGALLAAGEAAIGVDHDLAWLAVVAGNTRARRFYERSGWSEAGTIEQPSYAGSTTILVPALRYEKRVRRRR